MDTSLATSGTLTPAILEQRLADQKKERELMDQFVHSQLKDGTDYAPSYNGAKPTLLKPGSEKVCLLLNLMPVFEVDSDTHNLLSPEVKADTICYRCKLIHRGTGETVADGRGACSIKSKRGDVNTAIKIAEKRAQLDATLRVAALSDRFTQDMEKEEKPPFPQKTVRPVDPPAGEQTVESIKLMIKDMGGDPQKVWDKFCGGSDQPTHSQAMAILKALGEKKKQLNKELDSQV